MPSSAGGPSAQAGVGPGPESRAFAPAAITNFFEISYNSPRPSGATGGGYILSRGSVSTASMLMVGAGVTTRVNGDPLYDARTTRRAVGLLLSDAGVRAGVHLDQDVQTPIGGGFGASASSSTSAVLATAAAAGIGSAKARLALFSHRAEIIEQTGLGTVSVIFDAVGAGAITVPGEPGAAKFVNVKVPSDLRIVTAFVAPYDKKDALSSEAMTKRINELGRSSLAGFLSDPTLDNLAGEGERFSRGLGLESVELKKLMALAKGAGASYASQNMIGYSVHSLVSADLAPRVASALSGYSKEIRVDEFEISSRRAGLL